MNNSALPLYRSRLTEADFAHLQSTCRLRLKSHSSAEIAADFVRWAAEYYRRHYDGGVLSWSFLTEGLGISLEQEALRALTREGLRRHGRGQLLTSSHGTQYLASLAAEGGIPVQLLAQEGGYQQALLGLASDMDRFGAACPQEETLGFARRRVARLPMGYRRREFLEVFVEFAREISALRQAAPEEMPAQEIEAWLDRERPGWTENLVLQLDGPAARSLISQAIGQSRGAGATAPPIRRQIRLGKDGSWKGHVRIEPTVRLPANLVPFDRKTSCRYRLGVSGKASLSVPDLLFALEPDEMRNEWQCRRISGERSASFDFPVDRDIEVVAMADGKYLDQIDLPGGAAVSLEMPSFWSLVETGSDGEPVALDHAGNANLRTIDPKIWLWLPLGKAPMTDDKVEIEEGSHVLGGKLWQLQGKGRVRSTGWNAHIETSAETSDRDEIVAHGKRSHQIRDASGQPIYLGIPSILAREAGKAFREPSARDLFYRVKGRTPWSRTPPGADFAGRLEIAIRDEGSVGMRIIVQVLPRNAEISMRGQTGVSLSGFPPRCLVRIDELDAARTDASGRLDLEIGTLGDAFDLVPFFLTSHDQVMTWSIVLSRACPGFAWLDGDLVTDALTITSDEVSRLKYCVADGRPSNLTLKAMNGGQKLAELVLVVPHALPMSHFRTILDGFLVMGNADASIRLRAFSGAETSPRLTIRRFVESAKVVDDALVILNENEQVVAERTDLIVEAIDLDSPSKTRTLEGDELNYLRGNLGPGRWFMAVKKGARLVRPPAPFNIAPDTEQEVEASPEFLAASSRGNRKDRIVAFREVLRSNLGQDLTVLSKTIDFLFLQGLSPSVYDPVHALHDLPVQSLRLLFNCAPERLRERLSLGIHGGPDWTVIGPIHWATALAREIDNLTRVLTRIPSMAETAHTLAKETLRQRVRAILDHRPDLAGHAALALIEARLCGPAELATWLGAMPRAFGNPEKEVNDLAESVIRKHGHIAQLPRNLVAPLRPARFDHFDSEIRPLLEAPLLLAAIAQGIRSRPSGTEKLEILKALHIDPGYFDEALPAAMAYLFTQATQPAARIEKTV